MDDVIRVEDQHYIVARADRVEGPVRVLKHGDLFAVFDPHGDVLRSDAGEQGLYFQGTRFLSVLELRLGKVRPLLLSSTVRQDNVVFSADLTNPDLEHDGEVRLPRGELHVFRGRLLHGGRVYERVRLTNHGTHPLETAVVMAFDADFADVFEVRGTRRARRGTRLPDVYQGQRATLRYQGLDGVERTTSLVFAPPPAHLGEGEARWRVHVAPRASVSFDVLVSCGGEAPLLEADAFERALELAGREAGVDQAGAAHVSSANTSFDAWVQRSQSDLRMMVTDTPYGPYPYAGVPWYSTPFGRDGVLTALQLLWADPRLAQGVLAFLAATQATASDAARDAEPGKVIHEMRGGEMAALGEVPFGLYYGSVDATPLFVVLADAYERRTADLDTIRAIWPAVERALAWMDGPGDRDGDGFVEYARRSERGLVQQGWKDSHDSVFHGDGRDAEAPIALCEVQAYVYAAKCGASRLAQRLGEPEAAAHLGRQAEALRVRFEEAFWSEEIGTYALALDGDKRPCRVKTSNAGHCLFAGIASEPRARRVASALMEEASFSGWGIRTVAAGQSRYNPMSYHNGSVWPHDTALCAAGMARYGLRQPVVELLGAMLDASTYLDLRRMPELVCGFHRRSGEGPTLYPVACAPQSWSAGAVFLLIQSCLGLTIEAAERRVSFVRPMLPDCIPWMLLRALRVGDARVDLRLERHGEQVLVEVLRKQGELDLQVLV